APAASPAALAEARAVAERLEGGGARVQIVSMRTEGDRRAEARLAAVGGKGLFVREIEEALLRGDADVAVHSLKDLPADLPPGLTLAVFPERDDARDVLVTRDTAGLDALPRGAVIGTSSPRRRAIVLSLRPDLVVTPIRGNIDTRLAKLATREWDAVLLAAAGLRRLGLAPHHATPLAPDVFVPAVGEGGPALEGRTIVVTRAAAQARRFTQLLEAAGARVIEAPAIVIAPPASWELLDAALSALSTFTWLVFTSVNGVSMVDRRLSAL